MTMEKMLRVHDEVERQNAEHLRRYKLMEMHAAMVRGGQYEEARMVLRLLRRGYLRMGLDNVSWAVQTALENAGHPVWYGHNGNSAYAYAYK